MNNSAPDCKNTVHYVYDYSKFEESQFQTDYTDIQTAYNIDDIVKLKVKFDRFLNDLYSLFDKHCPKKILSKNALILWENPWINIRVRRLIAIRDVLFQQIKFTNPSTVLAAYKQFCTHIVKLNHLLAVAPGLSSSSPTVSHLYKRRT